MHTLEKVNEARTFDEESMKVASMKVAFIIKQEIHSDPGSKTPQVLFWYPQGSELPQFIHIFMT